MPFDFDPFSHLDTNFDNVVDAHDLQIFESSHGLAMDLLDLNHDGLIDQFQVDLNHDGLIDQFQVDLNHNSVIDKYDFHPLGVQWNYDLNHDGKVDYLDETLAKILFPK